MDFPTVSPVLWNLFCLKVVSVFSLELEYCLKILDSTNLMGLEDSSLLRILARPFHCLAERLPASLFPIVQCLSHCIFVFQCILYLCVINSWVLKHFILLVAVSSNWITFTFKLQQSVVIQACLDLNLPVDQLLPLVIIVQCVLCFAWHRNLKGFQWGLVSLLLE